MRRFSLLTAFSLAFALISGSVSAASAGNPAVKSPQAAKQPAAVKLPPPPKPPRNPGQLVLPKLPPPPAPMNGAQRGAVQPQAGQKALKRGHGVLPKPQATPAAGQAAAKRVGQTPQALKRGHGVLPPAVSPGQRAGRVGNVQPAQAQPPQPAPSPLLPARKPPPKPAARVANRGGVRVGEANGSGAAPQQNSPPSGGLLNTARNAKRVFDRPIVKRFSADAKATNQHKPGLIRTDKGIWVPKEGGKLGKLIGAGFNSIVFLDTKNPKKYVHKLVPIQTFVNYEDKQIDQQRRLRDSKGNPIVRLSNSKVTSVNDQNAGREMLTRLHKLYKGRGLDSLFRVAEVSQESSIWEVKGPDGRTHKFSHTRDENISSPVFDSNGKAIKGDNGKFVTAPNAFERLELRIKNKKRSEALKRGQRLKLSDIRLTSQDFADNQLSDAEELTINLVIRGLNQNGIVWTDHKLQNLDVVKDKRSPTGYRVIFFDFDAFRPVKGENRATRYAEARNIQKKYDKFSGWDDVAGTNEKFDFTAFGQEIGPLASKNANVFRTGYFYHDSHRANVLNKTVLATSQGTVRSILEPD